MENLSFYVIGLLVILATYYFLLKMTSVKLPPGPPWIPFLGSLPFVQVGKTCQYFDKYRKKYGDMFTLYVASLPVIVVCGYDKIKALLADNGASTLERPDNSFLSKHIQRGKGIGPKNGKIWKAQYDFFVNSLQQYSIWNDQMRNDIQEEVNYFFREIDKLNKAPFDPLNFIIPFNANIIMKFVCAERLENDAKLVQDRFQGLFKIFEYGDLLGYLAFCPWLRFIPGDPFGYYKIRNAMDAEFEWNLKEITKLKSNKPEFKWTLIHAYLDNVKKTDKNLEFSEEELGHLLIESYLGGIGTSLYSLLAVIGFLVEHQKEQQKIFDEVGGIEEISYQDRTSRTPFTTAFIDEVQRHADIAPITNLRRTSKEISLGGYVIPKGTAVLPYLSSVMTDPGIWENPGEFKPQRFLDDDGNYFKRQELMQFSTGPRICPGELLAKMELYILTVMMVRQYSILPPENMNVKVEFQQGLVKIPKPFKVRMVPR